MKKFLAMILLFALFSRLALADAGLSCAPSETPEAATQKLARGIYQIDFYSKKLMEASAFQENGKTVSLDAIRDRYVDAFSESMLLRACGNPLLKGAQRTQALGAIPSKPQIKYQLSAQEQPSAMLGSRIGFASLTSRVQATLMYQMGFPHWNSAPEAALLLRPPAAPEIILLASAALHQTISKPETIGEAMLGYWQPQLAPEGLDPACNDAGMLAILDQKMMQNGLYDRGFDKALLVSLMAHESMGCDHGVNGGGIMQVDACLLSGGCSLEENIQRGTAILASSYDRVQSAGVTDKAALGTIALFGYNRGDSLAATAAEMYASGTDLQSALFESCMQSPPCPDIGPQECCDIGKNYPKYVLNYYESATSQIP